MKYSSFFLFKAAVGVFLLVSLHATMTGWWGTRTAIDSSSGGAEGRRRRTTTSSKDDELSTGTHFFTAPESSFSSSPPTYDHQTALQSLYYCKSSYCPSTVLWNWTCGPSCDAASKDFHVFNIYDNTSSGNLGFSGMDHERQTVVIAFRGTCNTANWIQDLDFWTTPYPNVDCGEGCLVHRGFYQAYASIREQLLHDVATMHIEYPTYRLIVTGHSLGGAIALLAALELSTRPLPVVRRSSTGGDGAGESLVATDAEADQDSSGSVFIPVDLYTFGEPRVGNRQFTVWATSVLPVGQQHRRLTHARDPVPHLPPQSWGYLHTPHEVWFPSDDAVAIHCNDSSTSEDLSCSNSIWATSVADHLLYLGICTRCTCPPDVMEEISSFELSPEKMSVISLEFAQNVIRRRWSATLAAP